MAEVGRKVIILIACGSGIATATMVGEHIRELMNKNNVNAEVRQCGVREIVGNAPEVDVIVTTAKYQGTPVSKPIINALPVLTGMGVDVFDQKLLDAVKNVK